MAAWMDMAKDAPPIVERKGRVSTNAQPSEKGERVPLELPERIEKSEETEGEE